VPSRYTVSRQCRIFQPSSSSSRINRSVLHSALLVRLFHRLNGTVVTDNFTIYRTKNIDIDTHTRPTVLSGNSFRYIYITLKSSVSISVSVLTVRYNPFGGEKALWNVFVCSHLKIFFIRHFIYFKLIITIGNLKLLLIYDIHYVSLFKSLSSTKTKLNYKLLLKNDNLLYSILPKIIWCTYILNITTY